MMELRLYADRTGLHEGTPWSLLDGNGRVQVEGHGISTAPAADCVLIIVPDDCISVVSLPLPDLPPKRLKQALPTIIEDNLLTTAELTETVLLEPPADGIGTLAAFGRDWLNSLLSVSAVSRCPMVRVVAESWALARAESEACVHVGADHIVFAMPRWAACTEPSPSGAAKPESILFALRKAIQGEGGPAEIACYFSPATAGQQLAWLDEFGLPIKPKGIFDWRTASYKAAPSIHVRQRKAFPYAALLQAVRPAMAVCGALIALEFFATAIAWGKLSLENRHLKAQQAAMFHGAMGPDAPLVDGEQQLLHRLAAQRIAAGRPEPSALLVLMSRLAENTGSAPALEEIRFESGVLTLQLKAREDAPAWLKLAGSAGLGATAETRDGKHVIRVSP